MVLEIKPVRLFLLVCTLVGMMAVAWTKLHPSATDSSSPTAENTAAMHAKTLKK